MGEAIWLESHIRMVHVIILAVYHFVVGLVIIDIGLSIAYKTNHISLIRHGIMDKNNVTTPEYSWEYYRLIKYYKK